MSSGEKAKPPATFEERNPFDISRRSGPEVAAEIAKRMVAWKQARARTSGAPTTIPSGPSGDAKSPSGDAKSPPIAAPVQPARMPKSTAPAPQPAPAAGTRSARSSTPRVPYFASASATRRAMPPAPSLKQGSARPQASTGDELAERADEPTIPIVAPMPEQAPRHDESRLDVTDAVTVATPETALAEAPPVAAASIEEAPPRADLGEDATPAAAPTELSDPVESPSVAEASEPISVEPDDNERRRAEARAIKARWMAAHDLDALIDTSGAGSDAGRAPIAGVPAATPTVRETGSGEGADPSAHEPQAAVGDLASAPGVKSDDAVSRDESPHDESAEPERAAPLEAAANVEEPAAEVASETAAAVRVPATPAPVVDRDVAREASALDFAALDEIAGRREPTFDAPTAQTTPEMAMPAHPEMPDAARAPAIAAQDEAADEPRAQPAANAAPEAATHRDAADEGFSIAALDEVAGRKEPTFDKPVQREPVQRKPVRRKALEIAPPVPADRDAARQMRALETPMEAEAGSRSDEPIARGASDVARQDDQAAVESIQLSIAALDEAVGRKEPTFDEPARPADTKPAAAQTAAPRIALRPIETSHRGAARRHAARGSAAFSAPADLPPYRAGRMGHAAGGRGPDAPGAARHGLGDRPRQHPADRRHHGASRDLAAGATGPGSSRAGKPGAAGPAGPGPRSNRHDNGPSAGPGDAAGSTAARDSADRAVRRGAGTGRSEPGGTDVRSRPGRRQPAASDNARHHQRRRCRE